MVEKITTRFSLPDGALYNAVAKMEDQLVEAWKLLQDARSFLLDEEMPQFGDPAIYLHNKARDWEELRTKIDALLYPGPPLEKHAAFNESAQRLEVWLSKGIQRVTLQPHHDYTLDSSGVVRLTSSMKDMWESKS